MADDPLSEVESVFEAMQWFRETNGLSHAGTTPGRRRKEVVIWGMRHPDPHLLWFDIEGNTFDPITREKWEELTSFDPPWPWNEDGTTLVYSYKRSWWQDAVDSMKMRPIE